MGNIVHTMTNRRYAEACVVRARCTPSLRCMLRAIGCSRRAAHAGQML